MQVTDEPEEGEGDEGHRAGEGEFVRGWQLQRGEGIKLVTETDNIAAQVHYHFSAFWLQIQKVSSAPTVARECCPLCRGTGMLAVELQCGNKHRKKETSSPHTLP